MTRFPAAVLACLVASSCAAWPEPALGARDLGDGRPATARAVALQGWRVSVSVRSARLWPLAVSVGPIRPARANAPGAWVEHDVTFANRSDRPVQFADTGFSGFLPRRRPILIAGDQRCGPDPSSLEIYCRLYMDAFSVAPHAWVSRTVTLYKGLPEMRRLVAGTYVLRTPIRFKLGRRIPEEGSSPTAVLRIAYEIQTVR